MIFFKRKEHGETPGAREVAAAVGKEEPAAMMGEEQPKQPPIMPYLRGPEGTHAPLFVKVERYKELLGTAQEVKALIQEIKQVFSVLSDLEGARDEAIKLLRISVQRLEHSMNEIDTELVKPVGYEPLPHGAAEIRHVEESLTNLQRNISGLRREVEAFRSIK